MPVTTKPQDKFAFLFSGPSDLRYRNDLINVYLTLTEYYNYPAGNIWVVWGGADNLATDFPGANNKSLNVEADPLSALISQYNAFATEVKGHVPDPTVTGAKNTALIYLTGIGYQPSDPMDPFDLPKLLLKPGTSDLMIDISELQSMFMAHAFMHSHINLVMQQDYANLFTTDIWSGISSNDKTLTNIENAAAGDDTGGAFTKAWALALQQTETVMVGGVPRRADELVYSSEPYLISLEQAKAFAAIMNTATYTFSTNGETAFLGKPEILIQDGDNSTVGWWESPDIYLTHVDFPGKLDDLYIPDDESDDTPPYKNTVNVVYRNIGTHPIRCVNLGIQVIIRTPMGPSDRSIIETSMETGTVLKPTTLTSYNVFSNSNSKVYHWDTPFYTGITHECLRAKITMPNEPITFTWDVLSKKNEAQLNTDQSSDPPKNGGKSIPGDTFRGVKKHIYSIHNPFSEAHNFIILLGPEFQKSLNTVPMTWWISRGIKEWERLVPKPIENGYKGIHLLLKSREVIYILGEFGFKPAPKIRKVRLPVEILIDKRNGVNSRNPVAQSLREKYSSISGFTIIMKYEPANLFCKVVDKKGRPVPNALVQMQTVNRLQEETIKADKNGEFYLKTINPDVYRLRASIESSSSNETMVLISGNESVKVQLEISQKKQKYPREK